MNMKASLATAIALLALVTTVSAQENDTIEIDFCAFDLPAWAMRGNLSGSLVVEFYIDRAGVPEAEAVTVLRALHTPNPLIPLEDIQGCIASWRFPNLAQGTRVLAVWNWKHGKGWSKLSVRPAYGPTIRLRALGEHSPYLRTLCQEQLVQAPNTSKGNE